MIRKKPWYAATDIAQVFREGTDPWGMTRVTDDLAAEFSPDVTSVDADTLLAAWTKVVGDVSGAEGPEDIAPHLEIVVSRYDGISDIWSGPSQLTSNNRVDRAPLPVVFGDTQGVLWIQNRGEAAIGNATDGDSLMFFRLERIKLGRTGRPLVRPKGHYGLCLCRRWQRTGAYCPGRGRRRRL